MTELLKVCLVEIATKQGNERRLALRTGIPNLYITESEENTFALTAIPTGMALGEPFPSIWDLIPVLVPLAEIGIDWSFPTLDEFNAAIPDDKNQAVTELLRTAWTAAWTQTQPKRKRRRAQ